MKGVRLIARCWWKHSKGQNAIIAFSALAALLVGASAAAQSSPSISAVLGPQPDSYLVTVSGFVPGATVYVNEVSCGALPCGAGPAVGFQQVIVPESGAFKLTMELSRDFRPHPGVTWRLIAAYAAGWTDAQINAAPTVRIPLHHDGVTAPSVGNSWRTSQSGRWPWLAELIAVLGVGAMSATLVYLWERRRHGRG